MAKMRVAVAMSGGVDSSVACLLLVRAGYDVVGLTMKLLSNVSYADGPDGGGPAPCCTVDTARDAAAVCHRLGVPHYTINLVEEFEEGVIGPFVKDYAEARTPNPCLLCNSVMKFGHLLRKAREIGAEYVATGHYVRAARKKDALGGLEAGGGESSGPWVENHVYAMCASEAADAGDADEAPAYLLRGVDKSKDQSYALYGLTQDMLRHSMFPLGGLTKKEVRAIAREAGLVTAERPESQEICFVTRAGYREFLERRGVTGRPGNIEDTSGRVVGRHLGLPFYTVGQRRGVGAQAGKPVYVVALDVERNVVVVGSREEAHSAGCYIEDLNVISGNHPDGPVSGTCMVRYRGTEVDAVMRPVHGEQSERDVARRALVDFARPLFAVTPGQALVFYQGDVVYGGGIISEAVKPTRQELLPQS